LVARSFANDEALRSETPKTLDRSNNKKRMRVDVVSGNVVNKVWF